jgi:hypothetical protein
MMSNVRSSLPSFAASFRKNIVFDKGSFIGKGIE